MSERGLMWDAFGLSCPASPSHIPVPPPSPQGPSQFWNLPQAQMCSSHSSLCPWWGRNAGPRKSNQKKHIFHSTPVGFNWGLGSANLLGLRKGCSMRRMKEQLPWMLEPSSLSSLPGAWAGGGELYTWRNIIPSPARKYFTSRLKIEAKMSSAIRGNRLGFKFCLSIFLYNVAVSIRK